MSDILTVINQLSNPNSKEEDFAYANKLYSLFAREKIARNKLEDLMTLINALKSQKNLREYHKIKTELIKMAKSIDVIVESEQKHNPSWMKKTALGLLAFVGFSTATADLPNKSVHFGGQSAYAQMTGSMQDIYRQLPPTNEFKDARKYVESLNTPEEKGPGFRGNVWFGYYLGNEYGNKIKKIFQEDSLIDFNQLNAFFIKNQNAISRVNFYEQGYLAIEMKQNGYGIVIPISSSTTKKIKEL